LRVAVVHDWLYTIGGAERVLGEILRCYPQADVFTLFDVLSPRDRSQLGFEKTRTSFLQRMPLIRSQHRMFLPLMPFAIEQFDLSNYDLVISSSYAVAKGVLTSPDQLHVSYVHSPIRYAWDMQHSYLRQSGYSRGLKGLLARVILYHIRMWDVRTAHGPDEIIANSAFIQRRIRKTYGRSSHIIYPPVNQSPFAEAPPRGEHFLAASRLVHYKNIEPIVRAFGLLPDLKLVVAGDGPEASRLRGLASPNISFVGHVEDEELRRLMATARAFVFAADSGGGDGGGNPGPRARPGRRPRDRGHVATTHRYVLSDAEPRRYRRLCAQFRQGRAHLFAGGLQGPGEPVFAGAVSRRVQGFHRSGRGENPVPS
jgi:glycosyltransferase involved in cell wall biosynthesis